MTEVLSRLVVRLQDPSAATRIRAAEQLCHLGAEARGAAVDLVRACADEDEEVRQWAVAALEGLGPPLASAKDALAKLISHEHGDVGYWACTLLGRLGSRAGDVVGALAAAVTGPRSAPVRQRAAWALGQVGPAARPALDALRQAAGSTDPRLARLAQEAIEQIGG